MLINDNIKKYRIKNNMSQEQLAEAMDVTRQSVSKWETGKANPDTDKLIHLASLFNIPITELTGPVPQADNSIVPEKPVKKKCLCMYISIIEFILLITVSVTGIYIINRNCPGYFRNLFKKNTDDYISTDLTNNNIFDDGIDGVIKNISNVIDLPEYLMLENDFKLSFTPDGTITSIDTMWYGYDERYTYVDSYLITYDCSRSSSIKIYTGGGTGDAYNSDKDVNTLLDELRVINLEDTVSNWDEPEYGILYKGVRSWGYNSEGIRYIDSSGQTDIPSDQLSEEISGPTVSVYCINNEDITPVRYVYCKNLSTEVNTK